MLRKFENIRNTIDLNQENSFRPTNQTPKYSPKRSHRFSGLMVLFLLLFLGGATWLVKGRLQFPWKNGLKNPFAQLFSNHSGNEKAKLALTGNYADPEVLGDTTVNPKFSFAVNVASIFKETSTFKERVVMEKDLTAPNVVFSLSAKGTGIQITGDQDILIENTDKGSSQNIFKTFKVGSTTFSAGSNADIIELVGNDLSISMDTVNKKITFTGETPNYSLSGWNDGSGKIYNATLTDRVGIGTSDPSEMLHVSGDILGSGVLQMGGASSGLAYNAFGTGTKDESSISSSEDLYVSGDFEVDGTIYGNISSSSIGTGFTEGSIIFQGASGLAEDHNNLYWDATNNRLGIGTSNPQETMHVVGTTYLSSGNIKIGNTYSFIPDTNLGSDLGSESFRFNNLYVGNINSNSALSTLGQAQFTYDPTTTAYTQGSVIINPTSPETSEWMLGTGIAGYQRSGIDAEGDMILGYAGDISAPSSDYPLSIYNHGTTRIAYFDTDGNLNIGGTIISGGGISASGDLTIAAGYSIVPSADQVNAISIGNAASTDFVSFDTLNSRVGIGTTTPTALFDIAGSASSSGMLSFRGTTDPKINILNNESFGIQFSPSGDVGLTEKFTILNTGNVGIGTTTPTSLFQTANNTLSTGILGAFTSTSTSYSTGNLLSLDWSPTGSTEIYGTGDLFKINVGQYGNAGNILNLLDNGSSVFSVSQTVVTSNVPVNFTSPGDVSIAYDLVFTNQSSSNIKAWGPLQIEGGESFENNDLTLKTYGTGNVVFEAGGDVQMISADPSFLFDTATATDTDFWMGVTEDAGADDDDYFSIGDGTIIGTNPFLNINTSGNVGIGITNPSSKLDVTGNVNITGYATASASLAVGYTSVTNGVGNAAFAGNVGIGTTAPATMFDVNAKFNVLSSGNVGVGTTAPGAHFEVESSSAYGGTAFILDNDDTDQVAFDLQAANIDADVMNLYADALTTSKGIDMSVDALTSGVGFYMQSTSTALSTGSLMSLDWSPSGSTEIFATGDLFKINVGQYGNVGNIMNIMDNGSSLFSISQAKITSALPHEFTGVGDVTISNSLVFSNQAFSNISSLGPLQITSGESFENLNLSMKTYGTGNFVAEIGGDMWMQSTDPSFIFDTTTATDTDFWMGVTEDAGADDDDYFSIGDGTIIGTNPFLNITTAGNVGIGLTNPTAKLDVTGNVNITGYATASASLAVGYTSVPVGPGNAVFAGNVGIGTTAPAAQFDIVNGAAYSRMNAGDADWTSSSSRTIKENFYLVDDTAILEKIANVPVYTYDFIDSSKDHMGLIAEDFYTVFGRGSDREIKNQEVQMALWLGVQSLNTSLNEVKAQHVDSAALLQTYIDTLSDEEVQSIAGALYGRINAATQDLVSQEATVSGDLSGDVALASGIGDFEFVSVQDFLSVVGAATITTLDVPYFAQIATLQTATINPPNGQELALANNTLVIDGNGVVTVHGDLAVTGTVSAKGLVLGSQLDATNSASLAKPLQMLRQGAEVASIDASGSATFRSISLLDNRGINVQVASGSANMRVTFKNTKMQDLYAVTVTPSWNTSYWVSRKTAEGFEVGFGTIAPDAAKIDWVVIE